MKNIKKRKSQSKTAMVSITFVVGILFLGMMGKSMNLQNQLSSYDSQISEEKLGLVKENEIVFKEGEEAQQGENSQDAESSQNSNSSQNESTEG